MTTEYKIPRAELTREDAPDYRKDKISKRYQVTPGLEQVYKQFGSLGFSALTEAYVETAAERDRLREQLNQACDALDFATSELEKAREQVKTLLKVCKLVQLNFQRDDASDNFLGDDDHEAWTAVNKAIKSGESEQAK